MKIGIISDIHGNYDALTIVNEELKNAGVDLIVNAGDNVGYSPFPDECVRLLKRENIAGVMGNYDESVGFRLSSCGCGNACEALEGIQQASLRWTQDRVSDDTREYLCGLPRNLQVETDFGNIMIMHGHLYKKEYFFEYDDRKLAEISRSSRAPLIIMGHTHQPSSRIVDGTVFVNPGSVGKPVDNDPRASYAIAEMGEQIQVALFRTEYPVEQNIKALEEAGLPGIIGKWLREGRSGFID